MPDQTGFPTHLEMMWPTLEALKVLGGSGTNDEIVDKLVEIAGYSSEIQNAPYKNGNMSRLEYRAAWARSYLKMIDAIASGGRGIWTLTKIGEMVAKSAIEKLVKDTVKKKNKKTDKTFVEVENEESNAEIEIEQVWQEQLLNEILKLSPFEFERLCQRMLRESGFTKVEVTGKSGDGGIDGTGVLRVNLLSFHVLFQCKRYRGSVDVGTVRDFRGAMVGRADKGLIITTGSFTSAARKEASRDGAPAIDLVDGTDLCELLKNLKLGVVVQLVEHVEVLPNWFSDF